MKTKVVYGVDRHGNPASATVTEHEQVAYSPYRKAFTGFKEWTLAHKWVVQLDGSRIPEKCSAARQFNYHCLVCNPGGK